MSIMSMILRDPNIADSFKTAVCHAYRETQQEDEESCRTWLERAEDQKYHEQEMEDADRRLESEDD